MSATSSCDQETDKASRDEPISGHTGCELVSAHGLDFQFRFFEARRPAPEALTARLDSLQNTSAI
jgi:hypothetical protein